jgi:2',3'-cyclic-nucleotide 2'-phosphodiesterase (5'-nucleotidase family)
MKRFTTLALVAGLALAVAGSAGARPDGDPPGQAKKTTTAIQLLSVSDWHGQLTPLGSGAPAAGGAAVLKAYFDQYRAANPNTLTFMAGDSWGASPPISSFFEDRPAVDAMNMMGISADTFGNHNFDRGVEHLQSQVERADFPFVAANLTNLEDNVPGAERWHMFAFGDVDVAVIGIVNEEAPGLVFPRAFGTIEITDSIKAANKAAIEARKAGADVVVVLTHKGIRGFNADGSAFGELIDFANGVAAGQIDVIFGDHTDFQYSAVHQDKILVVENKSKGATFADVQLAVDGMGKVVSKSATFHVPLVSGVTPDPAIQAFVNDLTAQLTPILGTVIGSSTRTILRSDSCGRADGRLCESLVGNVVTDALRTMYGTDFAISNSGGLRAALTCPAAGAAGFCSASTPGLSITRGSVLGVLPFGNVSVTGTVSGATIKAFLENGVSSMPGANGKFAQVSGLCLTYDVSAPAGSRVTSVVRQAADGSCTGAPVDLTSASSYSLATNDFMAAGGDGYPVVSAQMTSRNIMDQDLADYVSASSPISPSIQGRIVCTSSGAAVCPPITAP